MFVPHVLRNLLNKYEQRDKSLLNSELEKRIIDSATVANWHLYKQRFILLYIIQRELKWFFNCDKYQISHFRLRQASFREMLI